MDIPSSMLSFLAPNQPPSSNPEDLVFFFSSPTTEVDDTPIKVPALSNPASASAHDLQHSSNTNLDTLLQTEPSSQHVQPSSQHIYDPQTIHILPLSSPAKEQPVVSPHPRPSLRSDSYDSDQHASRRCNKRKRSLPVMKALARNNAPDVALRDDELVEIGEMHESEQSLDQSKELYTSLLAFKQCLAKHGYRMTTVHVDPVQPNSDDSYSFDFVLNKKPVPSTKSASSFIDDARRHSATSTNEANMTAHVLANEEEPPLKRARSIQPGETSNSASHRLACTVCSKLMADVDTLVRHFRHAHQELKPFSCPRCKGFYSSEGTLWHHIRNVHTETPRKYKCSHCDASYDSFGAKTRHEHATHNTGTPQFVCSFEDCRRAFNFPAHLESHALQMHPGFRPFACAECGKSFPSANGLTRHCREVHIRPQAYSCSCSKTYSKRCHLKRHLLRVHGMSAERVQEEMKKQPHPGLLHIMPPGPPASTE